MISRTLIDMDAPFDAAVIGAGPAGLQTALTLARMHRTVVVFDAGTYRNDPADATHNLIGHDGRPPASLRAAARADLARYDTVRVIESGVERIAGSAGAFELTTEAGAFVATRIVLATGVHDTLPDVPGLAEAFGSVAAHCPFCHGHEYAGRHVALLGEGPFLEHMAMLMAPIAGRLTAFTDGADLDPELAERLRGRGVDVLRGPVAEIVPDETRTSALIRSGDGEHEVGGILVRVESAPAAPHAEQLGVDRSEAGLALVDPYGRTSVAGVFAAGDIAQLRGAPGPMWSVANAIAAGAAAGAGVVQDIAAHS